jgi:pyruvate dehydrogenase E2 component (dihydrolipoamide acetyltransferase)
MAIEITMPKLSDTMTDGLFAVWKKNVGDRVERGDILAEVETDKSVMDLEAFASGVLIKIMVHGGENVPVGTVLGLIGEAGETVEPDDTAPPVHAVSSPAPPPPPPVAPRSAVASAPPEASHSDREHEKSSPLVRRLAREQGIELDQVTGSGPEGRVTEHDLDAFIDGQHSRSRPLPSSIVPESPPAEHAATSSMRQAISATVTRSWQTIPHFSATVEIDMEGCRKIVGDLKEWFNPIGYNTLVIKACARVLMDFPLLHTIDPAAPDDINISFAVSLADGLLMPVIRKCQVLSAANMEIEISRLADKCRAGRLTQDEMAGGHFSVSNLGMYGVDEFTALIMPGQAAILAVGAVRERPAVKDGELAVAATMRVTLCSDHRSVDGAYAASFLKELQAVLEKPASLLM